MRLLFQSDPTDQLGQHNQNPEAAKQLPLKLLESFEGGLDPVDVGDHPRVFITDDGFQSHDAYFKVVKVLLRHWWVGVWVEWLQGSCAQRLVGSVR